MHNSAQLRCFENGNDDFGVEAFWIGDTARVGYFVPLNGPLNGHSPSMDKMGMAKRLVQGGIHSTPEERKPGGGFQLSHNKPHSTVHDSQVLLKIIKGRIKLHYDRERWQKNRLFLWKENELENK